MADDKRNNPDLPLFDVPLPEPFTSKRFDLTRAEAGETTLPSPDGAGTWRWIGAPGLLGELGVADGRQVGKVAYGRIAGGLHAETGAVVRKTDLVLRGSKYVPGLYHRQGSFESDEVSSRWFYAGPKERQTIRTKFLAETKAKIARIAGTDRFVGAATIVEADHGIRVDWIALGADRGKGLSNPYDHNPTHSIPAEPLRDSLTRYGKLLDEEDAYSITERAEDYATALKLHQYSDEELRRALPGSNPFAGLRSGPKRVQKWWDEKGDAATYAVAIERVLIDRAAEAYAEQAKREEARTGKSTANPFAEIEAKRGKVFAAEVRRHAAVLASRLRAMPPDEQKKRQKLTGSIRATIKREGDIENAKFGSIVPSVALQLGRNEVNELKAEREREAAAAKLAAGSEVSAAPAADVAVGMG